GRVAGSLLRAAGVPELVTTTRQEYEALALKLARDPCELADFRQRVERARAGTPLFDTGRFTKNLEIAYRAMRDNYRVAREPRAFSVTSGDDRPRWINPSTGQTSSPEQVTFAQ